MSKILIHPLYHFHITGQQVAQELTYSNSDMVLGYILSSHLQSPLQELQWLLICF